MTPTAPAAEVDDTTPGEPGDEDSDAVASAGTPDESGGAPGAWLWAGLWALVVAATVGGLVIVKRWRGNGLSAVACIGALAAIPIFAACSSSSGASGGVAEAQAGTDDDEAIVMLQDVPEPSLPVTVVSADGREVTITDTSRIVPLWGNLSEVVFGLGLGDNVVGRDVTATFPEAEHLPLVTRGHDVSAEGVLSLHPTVVFASADHSMPAAALEHIRNVGVPVVVFEDPASVDDVIPRIHAVAEVLGVPDAGEALASATESELEAARAAVPNDIEPPRVAFLYMRGSAGVYLIAGPGSGADSMIHAAGAIDAGTAMNLDRAFTPITSEALVQAAPDVILMTTTGLESVGGIDGLVAIPGIAQTPAGRDRRVITMEDGLLYSFGPRTPAAVRMLVGLIYDDDDALVDR